MATERDKELSLVQHLKEFRTASWWPASPIAITTAISFLFTTTSSAAARSAGRARSSSL
jgi:hypothetical protein